MSLKNDSVSLNDVEQSFDMLQEIEKQTSEKIKQQRAHERVIIKAHVIVQPGNSSEFMNFKVQGVTGDISVSGFAGMFPVPMKVGDIYRISFKESLEELPMVFGRCLRCKFVSEDAFEAGFSFFSSVTLPAELTAMPEMASLI